MFGAEAVAVQAANSLNARAESPIRGDTTLHGLLFGFSTLGCFFCIVALLLFDPPMRTRSECAEKFRNIGDLEQRASRFLRVVGESVSTEDACSQCLASKLSPEDARLGSMDPVKTRRVNSMLRVVMVTIATFWVIIFVTTTYDRAE